MKEFRVGVFFIKFAMWCIEQVPELDSWYFDEEVTDAYNSLDDVLRKWEMELEEAKRVSKMS